ncbi:AMP-binding enzyme family protein [Histomonas meleagridis]|uniref:AMP-binding enzyme family protein n=1 Tax=Histomonas meleagridis TaxID=135588 RepID=UPI0035595773|nr:AMP-binding enzyme family protein [Histomonas meleagridis]KAH0797033.1 AMP-binding enzyme family protein [Histomonas meleagridis]
MGNNLTTEDRSKCIIAAPPEAEGESPIYINSSRIKENGGEYMKTLRSCPECDTTTKILDSSAVKFRDMPALGERVVKPDGTFGEYKFCTFKEFQENSLNIASALNALGFQKGDTIGIYSYSCPFWQMIFFGCQYGGYIPVPVYDSLGAGAAKYIVEHSECKAVFVIQSKIEECIKACQDSKNIKKIFVIESGLPKPYDKSRFMNVQQVIEIGKEKRSNFVVHKPTASDTAIYMYTSGSTGNPKGCILTQIGIVGGGTGLASIDASVTPRDLYFSFLPLAHVYEMCVQIVLIAQGTPIGFFSGDTRNLVDDMYVLQPTVTCAVPRVFNRIYEKFEENIKKLSWPMQKLIRWAINNKNEYLINNRPPSLLLEILFSKFRAALGGRMRLIVSGGAPILPEVYVLIRATLTPNVIQGYGLTEICAAGCVQQVGAKNPCDVGPPAISIDMKLRPVKDFDYDPCGNPPTGEILYRGPTIFAGYYKEEELTRQALDNGWFCTGDIGIVTEDGYIQIIDRAKQLVKLYQGEYLSLTTLTEKYSNTPGVAFIYLYADSHHGAPVALVIPTEQKIAEWKNRGIVDFKESKEAKDEILAALAVTAKKEMLRGFERIAAVALDDEPFTIENGLLTPSLKPQLHSLRNKYAGVLERVYEENPNILGGAKKVE